MLIIRKFKLSVDAKLKFLDDIEVIFNEFAVVIIDCRLGNSHKPPEGCKGKEIVRAHFECEVYENKFCELMDRLNQLPVWAGIIVKY